MTSSGATTYRVTVSGHLDERWADWLGTVDLCRDPDGTTQITADLVDQAQLHGLLAGLRDLNCHLVSVQSCDPPSPPRSESGARAAAEKRSEKESLGFRARRGAGR